MTSHARDMSSESSRGNGWSLPLHMLQVCGWLAFIYFMFVYFSTMVPVLPLHWQPAAYIINGLAAAGITVTMLVATSVNPADPAVLARGNKTVGRLDRSKHPHAIQNQHCYLCDVNVGPKSKHCRACNKCIQEFDHHCKWLNNCVGKRNYKWFLSSLIAASVGALVVLTVGLTEFVCYFVDKDKGEVLQPYIVLKEDNRENETAQFYIVHQPVAGEGWLTITAITTVLAAVTLMLLIHLLFFHFWLNWKGITTYEYIVHLREKEVLQEANSHKPSNATTTSVSNSSRPPAFRDYVEDTFGANKVTPSKTGSGVTKTGTGVTDKLSSQVRSEQMLDEYRQALERTDQADGGETPPPLSSPIHLGADGTEITTTAVRKLKKKKKKREVSSTLQDVATVGDSSLYSYPDPGGDNSDKSRKLPSVKARARERKDGTGSTRRNRKVHSNYSDSDESLTEVSPVDAIKQASQANGGKQFRPLPMRPVTVEPPSPKEEDEDGMEGASNGAVDLNATQMFTLSSSAKLLPDGSLDYSGKDAFANLPLTPKAMRRPKAALPSLTDVPPLDLATLQSSTDSTLSYRPYTGTVRSTDTYRPGESANYNYQYLGSVPEAAGDLLA